MTERVHTKEPVEIYLLEEVAFEEVFKKHFKALHAYAFTFVKDGDTAEDIVQSTFVKMWEKMPKLKIHSSVSAYLYRSVYNECLNYIKHQKVKATHEDHTKYMGGDLGEQADSRIRLNELQNNLSLALAELPEGCRTVFQMSRFESLKYKEIADELGISIKTVENQMGKALKILREQLKNYLPLLLFILSFYQLLFFLISK